MTEFEDYFKYTDDQLREAWVAPGKQGHAEAVGRHRHSVTFACSESEALALHRLFCRRVFNVPSCCHYDGSALTMYYGDTGCYDGGARERHEVMKICDEIAALRRSAESKST